MSTPNLQLPTPRLAVAVWKLEVGRYLQADNGITPLVTAVPLAPSARPGGPGATRSCPRVSTHAAPRFRASPVCDQSSSCAVDRTLASWILGASAPRCVVDSVRSGPAADPLNKYVGSWK